MDCIGWVESVEARLDLASTLNVAGRFVGSSLGAVGSADTGVEQLADLKEEELKRPGDLGDLGRVISLGNGTRRAFSVMCSGCISIRKEERSCAMNEKRKTMIVSGDA